MINNSSFIFENKECQGLQEYPRSISEKDPKQGINIIGDMHSNPIKWIEFALRNGIATMESNDYNALFKLHRDIDSALTNLKELLSKSDNGYNNKKINPEPQITNCIQNIKQWEKAGVEIIGKIKFNYGSHKIFMGDIRVDRVGFETWIDKLYEMASLQGVYMESLLGNHDNELIFAAENFINNERSFKLTLPLGNQCGSLLNLEIFRQMGICHGETFLNSVKNYYYATLKPLTCTVDKDNNKVSRFTHAPTPLSNDKLLAEKLQVEFKDNTPEEYEETCHNMYLAFQKHLKNQTVQSELFYKNGKILKAFAQSQCKTVEDIVYYVQREWSDEKDFKITDAPFELLTWNRDIQYVISENAKIQRNFKTVSLFGHTDNGGWKDDDETLLCLNSEFGKQLIDFTSLKCSPEVYTTETSFAKQQELTKTKYAFKTILEKSVEGFSIQLDGIRLSNNQLQTENLLQYKSLEELYKAIPEKKFFNQSHNLVIIFHLQGDTKAFKVYEQSTGKETFTLKQITAEEQESSDFLPKLMTVKKDTNENMPNDNKSCRIF